MMHIAQLHTLNCYKSTWVELRFLCPCMGSFLLPEPIRLKKQQLSWSYRGRSCSCSTSRSRTSSSSSRRKISSTTMAGWRLAMAPGGLSAGKRRVSGGWRVGGWRVAGGERWRWPRSCRWHKGSGGGPPQPPPSPPPPPLPPIVIIIATTTTSKSSSSSWPLEPPLKGHSQNPCD